jgi:hypothetical protein
LSNTKKHYLRIVERRLPARRDGETNLNERSAPEIARGVPGGDAAFADFPIPVSFTHRF